MLGIFLSFIGLYSIHYRSQFAIKANEMAAVGQLYNHLMSFLVANGAVTAPQQEVEGDGNTDEVPDAGNPGDMGKLPQGDESDD